PNRPLRPTPSARRKRRSPRARNPATCSSRSRTHRSPATSAGRWCRRAPLPFPGEAPEGWWRRRPRVSGPAKPSGRPAAAAARGPTHARSPPLRLPALLPQRLREMLHLAPQLAPAEGDDLQLLVLGPGPIARGVGDERLPAPGYVVELPAARFELGVRGAAAGDGIGEALHIGAAGLAGVRQQLLLRP